MDGFIIKPIKWGTYKSDKVDEIIMKSTRWTRLLLSLHSGQVCYWVHKMDKFNRRVHKVDGVIMPTKWMTLS